MRIAPRIQRGLRVISACTTILFASTAVQAEPLAISWYTIDGGGGRVVAAGGLALEGTIGQFDVGVSSSAQLRGEWGFWPGAQVLCRADFNGNGSLDFFDYLDFVQAFANDSPTADFNRNGTIDFFDYLDFVAAFDAGC